MPSIPRPQIFLIDGYALIYRAFYAMIARPLTTGRGENTSVPWGVANFLIRVQEDFRPDFIAWINDAGSSFRTEKYPEYKATRQKLDEELQDTLDRSIRRVEELLEAFRVPLVTVDGFEADDVIGTLATQAAAQGIHAVIVSGDKDFYQLLSPDVSLLNPGRGGAAGVQEELVTIDTASNRLGVPPERVIDYLALVGDSSDNVPGVRGVGDKTARKLIEEFGDLDSILAHAAEVKAKRAREALLAEADNARLSRDLVTILRDVDVSVDLATLEAVEPDPEALQNLFTELEFHSLIDKVGSTGDPVAVVPETTDALVDDVRGVVAAVAEIRGAGRVALRTISARGESGRSELIGLSVATDDSRGWHFPLGSGPVSLDLMGHQDQPRLPPLTDPAVRPLREWLEDPAALKGGHDIKYDLLALRSAGVAFAGIAFDSMIASFLLDPGRRSHALDVLGIDQFGVKLRTLADLRGKGKAQRVLSDVPISETAAYCNEGAHLVLRLEQQFDRQLESTGLVKLLRDVELPLVSVLAGMEWRGISLDTGKLSELSKTFRAKLDELQQAIHEAAGTDLNINSTPQLRHVLFEKLQLPVLKKTKTGPSTDAEVLAQLADMGFEVPTLLLEYRELSKLVSTYVDALPKSVNAQTGRVHTSFHQTGAATGRLSSSDPNLQNIPVRTARGGEIRRCFVPGEGLQFVVADYSQIELRLLAHLSDDPAFIAAFQRGGDIHRETAAIIFEVDIEGVTAEMRARAKTINFATIYGQGPFALARQLGIAQDEAKEFIARYFERFAGVRSFLDRTIERARERGYVETYFGRRRYIPELKDRNFNVRSFGERTAMNSPIQGSAADLIKVAMVNLDRRIAEETPGSALLLQVHDELVLEAPPGEVDQLVRIVREEMEGAATLKVPLVVDIGIGPNWLDAKL